MTPAADRMLTAREVAERLHIHINTVKRLGDSGQLPFFRIARRGDRRIRESDLQTFLAEREAGR
jgi:excisionase family DNA binding protein